MKLVETAIAGVVEVVAEPVADARGTFARVFDADTFAAAGLCGHFVQANVSTNPRRGTLRGLHYQAPPRAEPKLVRCTRGAVFDVAVDLRADSPTYTQWVGCTLDEERGNALYIPGGCAHGFITLSDDAALFYLMGAPFEAALQRGVRWDDPAFAIAWPLAPTVISPRDAGYPDFEP